MNTIDTLYYHLLIERDRLYRLQNRGKSSEFILGKISMLEEILNELKKQVDKDLAREEEILRQEINLKNLRKYKKIEDIFKKSDYYH
jgi:hypothetical protein